MSKDIIRIKPEEVRSAAKEFKNKSDGSQAMMNQLTNTWSNVKSGWQGETADQVDVRMSEWKKEMQKHVTMLSDIHNTLEKLAKDFEDFDAAQAKRSF